MNKIRFIFSVVILCNISSFAQDIHFSDFYSSPLNLNSAMTGEFVGNNRYIANYRWQYGTISVPYQTVSLSTDIKNNASRRNAPPIGYGVLFNYDFTGDSRYTSFQFGTPLAYHQLLPNKRARISYGILPQVVFNQIDISNLQFSDQFVFDKFYQNIKTKDIIPTNSIYYLNFSSGINTTNILSNKATMSIGGNIANIFKPRLSFFKNNDSRLQRRFSIMSKLRYKLSSTIELIPNAIFQFQGSLREYQFGANAVFYVDNINVPWISCGTWFRSREHDALILNLGFNVSGYVVGFNYDINLSKLSTASSGIGAFELTFLYIYNRSLMPHKFEAMKCPTHL